MAQLVVKHPMRDLPNSIAATVFRATDGEVGWRRIDIEQALLAIGDENAYQSRCMQRRERALVPCRTS